MHEANKRWELKENGSDYSVISDSRTCIIDQTPYYPEAPSAEIAQHIVECHNLVAEFGGDVEAIRTLLQRAQEEGFGDDYDGPSHGPNWPECCGIGGKWIDSADCPECS